MGWFAGMVKVRFLDKSVYAVVTIAAMIRIRISQDFPLLSIEVNKQ
jgi:hypothetical protein